MNPQNQNWSTSRAPTPTRKFQFQFHQTFYYMYQKSAFLEVKTASEAKSYFRYEISKFFYIYCHGHFLATSSLRDFDTDFHTGPKVIH